MRRKGVRDGGGEDVEAVLDELYALPPSAFVTRREERAAAARTAGRADDARRIHAARRPTLAAWAANLLRRSRPDEAERFLELGRALREAHATLDPSGMKELSAQRRRIVSALSRQAAELARDAGHPLSEPVRRDVETTLRAVLADPEAAGLWATGRVESALTPPSGFPAETAEGTGPARGAPRDRPVTAGKRDRLAEQRAKRLARAREAARAAEEELRARRVEREDTAASLAAARERRRETGERVSALEAQLQEGRAALERAEREQREAEQRDRTAADALDRARREADEAAAEAERAEQGAR
ncbi:hypothetical protein [Streptomyces pilosus]|uniref:Uncharacterized protein n=1 Tax=Streptomyces pilosus TaxID=28893 RepID=A0A918EUZ0_9ACTN|nr:hypothetical protein [Streptomyces pilosus]GGQ69195.1 hypothetical protein GCM10010280_14450 [Streptomyces pilosus]GGV54574.1 hypothetical protein GCM10010261_37350 [Streptomyces pilosus]